MFLEKDKFLEIINNTPLVSIDLIVKNEKNEVLLGLRKNKPAQGYWFVPGGRILKNEKIKDALSRISKTETGLEIDITKAKLLGVYDHIYNDNFAGSYGINTHYVVIAFEINLNQSVNPIKDSQHDLYQWWKIDHLLLDNMVHLNTKNYFQ